MSTLRELNQGYLLHVLFALALLGKPSTKTEIADEVGCSPEAVETACRVLSRAEHSLVIGLPNGRWPRWALTPNGCRYLLAALAAIDRQISMIPLAAASDSSFHNLIPLPAASTPMYGVVVGSIEHKDHLTTPPTNMALTPLPAGSDSAETPDPRVARLLLRLGVWPNVARDVAAFLADDDYINLRDVLGWIVYVRYPANGIRNEAAVVAKNLLNRQRPASPYRAAYLCGHCRRMESMCPCAAPDLYLPDEFDDLAFSDQPRWEYARDDWLRHLWFCPDCGGRPCQCPKESADER